MNDEVDKPPMESYKELQARLKETKQTKAEVLQESGGLDLDNLPTQTHNFVKRGIVISCEGAGHPNHRHFLVNK